MVEKEKKQDLTDAVAEKPAETPVVKDKESSKEATVPKGEKVSAKAGGKEEPKPPVNGEKNATGMGKQTIAGKKTGAAEGKRPSFKKKGAGKPLDAAARRKQALKEEKLRINADLKKTARKIMLGGTLSTIVAVAGLFLMTTGHGETAAKVGGFLLVLGVIGFGILGGIVFRMYNSGQEATRKKQQRQRSQMARQDMHQFISMLSVETREKLMQVDAREKVAGGKTAEVMFLKLNDDELSNALQFLCMTSRTGEVELTFDKDGGNAVLHLGDGTVLFAKYGEYKGLEAIARMLKAGAAEASFYEGRVAPGKNIDMPISGILLNASVMGDEM